MKRFGLPKACLLRETREFDHVYKGGRRLHGKGFTLIYLAGDQTENRLGISVQRKVGKAVHRNRIKRIIRETFRLHRDIFPRSSDIVLTVRPGFSLERMRDVRDAVAGLTAFPGRQN